MSKEFYLVCMASCYHSIDCITAFAELMVPAIKPFSNGGNSSGVDDRVDDCGVDDSCRIGVDNVLDSDLFAFDHLIFDEGGVAGVDEAAPLFGRALLGPLVVLDGDVHGAVLDGHVRAGADAAAEGTEVHVGGLDVEPHLVRVGERLAALGTLFVLLLLVHVEDVAAESLLASKHPGSNHNRVTTNSQTGD